MSRSLQHLQGGVRARVALARRWWDQRGVPTVDEGLDALTGRWPVPEADDEPVFLLACGWRSGSTLLQRMVISGGRHLVWGEPYQHADLVGGGARSARAFVDQPRAGDLLDDQPDTGADGLSRSWIANLYPDPADYVEAQRALFRRLYADPARRAGYPSWGLKEVRYGFPEARYLHVLFPRARFVFLHRDPYDAWYSFQSGHRGSAWRWPEQRVWTASQFGRMWRTLVDGVIERAGEVDGLVLRYEDLDDDKTVRRLEEHLGLRIDRRAAGEQIGSTAWGRSPLRPRARRLLARQVEPRASELGYG